MGVADVDVAIGTPTAMRPMWRPTPLAGVAGAVATAALPTLPMPPPQQPRPPSLQVATPSSDMPPPGTVYSRRVAAAVHLWAEISGNDVLRRVTTGVVRTPLGRPQPFCLRSR